MTAFDRRVIEKFLCFWDDYVRCFRAGIPVDKYAKEVLARAGMVTPYKVAKGE